MASKSKRRRRVLGASCILAALIIAGSSFAWFTSKDEVTNRLTATADYGVSVVEDFTPPKDMTPGQVVNKDVATVNTGSVDAFVRLKFENAVDFTRYTSQDLATAYSSGKTYYTDPSTGAMSSSDMTGEDTSGTVPSGNDYQYDLRVFTAAAAPSAASGTELVTLNPVEQVNSDGTTTANEVTTLMTGGKVVVAASTAVAPENQNIRSGDDINGGGGASFAVIYTNGTDHMVKISDTEYHVLTTDENGYYVEAATPVVATDAQKTNLRVEALAHDYSGTGQYKLAGNGLYLFKRTTSTGSTEHSGFYYYDGTFYALKTKTEGTPATTVTPYVDGTITYESGTGKNPDVVKSVAGIDLLSTQHYTTPSDGAFTMELTATRGGTALTADYDTATYMTVRHHISTDDATKDIIFYVKLANNWKDYWTYVPATVENGAGYFYYNTKLESGQTSKNLIDSVELADTMTSQHYLDMTYDLKVALDSVQVTKDEHGNETMAAVVTTGTNAWATPTPDYNGSATGTTEGGDGTIDSIAWS